jgi:hypothetical protein
MPADACSKLLPMPAATLPRTPAATTVVNDKLTSDNQYFVMENGDDENNGNCERMM